MLRSIRWALLVLLAAAPFAAAQEERDRAKIPDKYKWNLAEIYPSDEAWRTAKDALVARIPEIARLKGTLGRSPAALLAALDLQAGLTKQLARLSAYAGMSADQDTRESRYQMGAELTDGGWHFADRSLTNAEIVLRLYRTLRTAAGDAVLLGCNTIGHLGAGLFEIQRTGDDTSGRSWERTRRMGVNTLAFRLPQHRTFFASDADCAAHTDQTPWELDRQYLDLVARSGTALFVSVDPRTIQPEQKAAFRAAMQTALSGGSPGGCEPLDWLHTTAPRVWRVGDETLTYRWEEPAGAYPMRI